MVLIDRKEHDISGANVQQAIQMYKLTFLRKFAILIKSKDIDGSFERVDQIFSMHYAGEYRIFFSACIRAAFYAEICNDIENRSAASV